MSDRELELLQSRQLFLMAGLRSSDVIFQDAVDGNWSLAFELRYVPENTPASTEIIVDNASHANVIIETRENATTHPETPIEIGRLEDGRKLYISFMVQPRNPQSKLHELTLMLYRGKEAANA